MTKVLESNGLNKTINIITLKDPVKGTTVPAICVKIDRNEEKLPGTTQEHHDGNVLSSSTLATCRKEYPSGCTILECRLDSSNRPVAHVFQVPGDSDATSQKMSVLVEAKQTPSGPYSRVTSCPVKDTCESSNDQEDCKNAGMLRTYALESGDNSNNNDNNNEGTVSKILYGTTVGEAKEVSNHGQDFCKSPKIYVECDSTKMNNFIRDVVKPEEIVYRSPPNCEDTCTGARKYPGSSEDKSRVCFPTERRNGLEPTGSEFMLRGSLEKSLRRPNRVCPATCCKPIERSVQEKQKPSTSSNLGTVSKKCSKDKFSVSPSQDSLERYKDYVSPNQLEKYRSCRSKRNGLQDQCFLPLPRALLEREREERGHDRLGDDCKNLKKNEDGTKRSQRVRSSLRKASKPEATDKSSQKSVNKNRRRLKRVKSRELYAGRVLIDCDCYHRNGLQHDCPRTLCGGEPCTEKPLPKCDLGSYFLDKWNNYHVKLDRLMPTAFCGTEEQWFEEILKRKNGNYFFTKTGSTIAQKIPRKFLGHCTRNKHKHRGACDAENATVARTPERDSCPTGNNGTRSCA